MVCFLLRYDLKFLVTGLPCYCNELNKKKLINLLVMSLNTNRLQTEREGRSRLPSWRTLDDASNSDKKWASYHEFEKQIH